MARSATVPSAPANVATSNPVAARPATAPAKPQASLESFDIDVDLAEALDAEFSSLSAAAEPAAAKRPAEPRQVTMPAPPPASPQRSSGRPSFGSGMFGGEVRPAAKPVAQEAKPAPAPAVAKATNETAASPASQENGRPEPRKDEDEAFDTAFVSALAALSAPADPLSGKVSKTEAFAPERRVEETTTVPVLDDFDALLAGEMAALNLDKSADKGPIAGSRQAPVEADYSGESEHPVLDDDGSYPRILSTFAEQNARQDSQGHSRPAKASSNSSFRRIAAGIVGLAVIGGAGFAVLDFSGSGEGDASPLIVKADTDPVKIVPPDPGGRTVANQENATYREVSNQKPAEGEPQGELVTAAETPIGLDQNAAPDYDGLPGVNRSAFSVAMSDAQIEDATPVLQPRRVPTVTVLPDGTIVAGKATETMEPNEALIETASRPLDDRTIVGGISSPAAAQPALDDSANIAALAAGAEDVPAVTVADEPVGVAAPGIPVPSMKPRVSAPTQVASLAAAEAPTTPQASSAAPSPAPVAAAAASGSNADAWYVQMSSQPTDEAARASAATISSRYSGILAGRQVVIQTAEIPGKGTYHRVRMAASSKQEAATLCEQMKSAGGSCYVSR
ncbi:SPOR domain-containing protein [Fulvimarina endophytica]|uniref:SPOR domain-containing protein n=1 Tax=Fulvimarina endophytica TaxID=2293836 RepID=UPI001AECCED2|nr:SPOR domain-containing protein [Fulvimarina endophytica]